MRNSNYLWRLSVPFIAGLERSVLPRRRISWRLVAIRVTSSSLSGALKLRHLVHILPRLASVLVTQQRQHSQDRQVDRRKPKVTVQGLLLPGLRHLKFEFLEFVPWRDVMRSEEHTSELQSPMY